MRRLSRYGLCLILSLQAGMPVRAQPATAARGADVERPADAMLLAEVDRRLKHPVVLRGRFEQEKILQGFSKPVASRGDFTVVKDKGVIWTTKAPYPERLVITRKALTRTDSTGTARTLDASREPAFKAINEVMFALLSGDVRGVGRYFKAAGTLEAKRWSLTLSPVEAGWRQVVQRIELDGDDQIRRLELLDANGDRTRIRLLNGQADKAPTRDEAVQLD